MKSILREIYIAIYLLFLLTVLLLFAAVTNAHAGSAWIYLSIFLIMVLGSALFSLTYFKTELLTNSNEEKEVAETGIENIPLVEESIQKASEKDLDLLAILPVESNSIDQYTEDVLKNIANDLNIIQGLFYVKGPSEEIYHCCAQYAYFSETKPNDFSIGETLPGQAVKNKAVVALNDVPINYMTIASGLGKGKPRQLVFVPISNTDEVLGLIEYATFEPLTEKQHQALEKISKSVADTIVELQKSKRDYVGKTGTY
jgi:hypothetical protein